MEILSDQVEWLKNKLKNIGFLTQGKKKELFLVKAYTWYSCIQFL